MILDHITDVRNFGAIARTAECSGVDAIVIPPKGSAAINEDAMKTSAGALNIIPVCRTDNLVNEVKFLKDSGLKVIAATEKGSLDYDEEDLSVPLASRDGCRRHRCFAGLVETQRCSCEDIPRLERSDH